MARRPNRPELGGRHLAGRSGPRFRCHGSGESSALTFGRGGRHKFAKLTSVIGFPTPEDAALDTMPKAITHVIRSQVGFDEESGWVMLAVEAGPGFYLDENVLERAPDGSWLPSSSGGGGFTDRTLDDLRASPPQRTLWL